MTTHYETLNCPPSATSEQLKSCYRLAAKLAHPDREGGSVERMQAVNRAYEVLSDPERRAAYDRGEGDGKGATEPPMEVVILMSAFQDELKNLNDQNIVKAVGRKLRDAVQNHDQQLAKLKADKKKLIARLGKISYRGEGESLLEGLLQGKLKEIDEHTEQLVKVREGLLGAEKLLWQYGDDWEASPTWSSGTFHGPAQERLYQEQMSQFFKDMPK